MDTLLADVRYALRALRRTPVFTAGALLSLALGIGANTTVFNLVNAIQFRPLPYREADRLVDVHEESATELCQGCGVGTSYPGYLDWQRETRTFEDLGAYVEDRFTLSGAGDAEPIGGAFVSANLFPLLGVAPALGRLIRPDEDRVGGDRVVILGDEIWRRRFGADPRVLGRSVKLNGAFHTIVGVMPPRFGFPEFARVWVPLAPRGAGWARDDRRLAVIGRLRRGATLDQARAEVQAIAARLERSYPQTNRRWSAAVARLRDSVAADIAFLFWTLLGAVAFVLLIACANLASLLLVRASARQREMAIRVAVGAGRGRLVRQLLVESLVLSAFGGALGLVLSLWGTDLVVAAIGTDVPFWIELTPDWRVAIFCAAASIATGLAFGLAPALQASRPDVERTLRDEGPGTSRTRRGVRLRTALVAAEIAMALLLLTGAGLMIKTFLRFSHDDPGYDVSPLLTAEVDLQSRRYDDPQQIGVMAAGAVARLERVPGVRAAFARTAFLAGFGAREVVMSVEGVSAVPESASPRFYSAVTPGYFQTLGLRTLRGRTFTEADAHGAAPVALINEQLARLVWPDRDPIGARIKLGPADAPLPWLTVVGVVGNAGQSAVTRRPFSFVYVPLQQSPGRTLTLTLRAPGEPMAMAATVRSVMREVDPDEALRNVMSAEASRARQLTPQRFLAVLMSSLAVLGLVIAAVGIYAVVAYVIGQRTHEIGIRLALGASRRDVLTMILGGGLRLAAIGVTAGVVAALALTRVLRGMLFGTSPTDPIVFASVAAILAGITMAATYIPARRAAATDPWLALRGRS